MFTSSVKRGGRPSPKRHIDRREERIEKVKSATICVDGADMNFPCTVRDIHSSGARMSIQNAQNVADSFLLIVRSENLVARCKVAWRKTNELGVRFVRVGDLLEESRMKIEQHAAFNQAIQQQAKRQEQERIQAEHEAMQRQQAEAMRAARIATARMQIMGMDPTQPYTLDDLKAAYRRQAMTKHPDQGGDPVEFQQLTEIYNLMAQAFEPSPPREEGSAI